jgi:hypothetical protein
MGKRGERRQSLIAQESEWKQGRSHEERPSGNCKGTGEFKVQETHRDKEHSQMHEARKNQLNQSNSGI